MAKFYETGRIVSTVCHGATGLLNVNLSTGDPLVRGSIAYAYAMHERNVLNDNEWTGWWLLWMRSCFKHGTITEYWKQIQSERWLSPAFENYGLQVG